MTLLLLLIILFILILIIQRYSLANSLRGIDYRVKFSKKLIEPNETIEIISEINNYKKLPEIYIKLVENIPGEAE